MKVLLLLLAFVALCTARSTNPEGKIEPNLFSKLLKGTRQGGVMAMANADVIISFEEGTEDVLEAISGTRYDTRADLLNALHEALLERSEQTQVAAKAVLDQARPYVSFTSYWLTNQVYAKNMSLEWVIMLSQVENVKIIYQEEIFAVEYEVAGDVVYSHERRGKQDPEGEWGIRMIQAKEARELLNSESPNAHPVVVATIDTGARYTHEALRDNFVGPFGWFDPYDKTPTPIDYNGHGTHTTATIAGGEEFGVGVYPGAKWMACRGCATSSCAQSALIACAQFVTCPTNADGSLHDCSKAPNLVSNSWGGGRGNTWFDSAIAAFHVARIIPLFSIGNSGPACNSANSPGDRDVIGVGSTTDVDNLSSFSSVGPTVDGRMKPDVSAPGSNVLSAYHTNDTAYRALSGTSMACPHAAGLTALLFAYNPDVVYANVTKYIRSGVDTPQGTGKTCAGVGDDVFPNHHFGQGRINAFKSLNDMISESKRQQGRCATASCKSEVIQKQEERCATASC